MEAISTTHKLKGCVGKTTFYYQYTLISCALRGIEPTQLITNILEQFFLSSTLNKITCFGRINCVIYYSDM